MRRKQVFKKYHKPDIEYGSIVLTRFINYVMKDGKKSTAERVVYAALDKIKEAEIKAQVIIEQAKQEAAQIIEQAKLEKVRLIKQAQEQ